MEVNVFHKLPTLFKISYFELINSGLEQHEGKNDDTIFIFG